MFTNATLESIDEYGEYKVFYVAEDAAGNEATCWVRFEVILKGKCSDIIDIKTEIWCKCHCQCVHQCDPGEHR